MAEKRRLRLPEENPDDGGGSSSWPESFARIWTQIAAVPVGAIASYGEIARRAGLPRRARLVAQALRAAPDDLALPWHRILRSDGRIAFKPGSSPFRRQKRLLEAEGVSVAKNGRVLAAPGDEDLDAAIWR